MYCRGFHAPSCVAHSRLAICLILAALILTACQKKKSSKSEEAGAVVLPFAGRLILYQGLDFTGSRRVVELRKDPNTGKITLSLIADNLVAGVYSQPVVSPGNHHLLYCKQDGTYLRDLGTGAVRRVLSFSVSDLDWAPDSKHFCYTRDHQIFISDLSGHSQAVYSAPSSTYYVSSSLLERGEPQKVFGVTQGPTWVGADRLVFQRFKGTPPSNLSSPGKLELAANTTTLAVVDGTPKLTDSTKRLHAYASARCSKGSFVLFEIPATDKYPYLMARDFRDFQNTEVRSISLESHELHRLKFMPETCRLYFIRSNRPGGEKDTLHFVDPVVLQDQPGVSLNLLRLFHDIQISPDEKMMALSTGGGISLVDLNTGQESSLIDDKSRVENGEVGCCLKILAWLRE